jgi:hypothetical protein
MRDVTVSIDLAATPAEVWAIVEPVENHVDWMADAVAIRFETEQTRGIGTKFLCDTKIGPIKLVDQMEITVWTPASNGGDFPWYFGGRLGEIIGGKLVLSFIWKRNLKALEALVNARYVDHDLNVTD